MSGESWITLASAVGEAAVVATMLGRGLWRKLPVFLAYIVWALLSDCAAFYFQTHGATPEVYLAFYHVMMSVDGLLQFTVLVELAWSVLNPVRSQLPKGTLVVLIVLVAVIAAIAWPIAAIATPAVLVGEGITVFRLAVVLSTMRIVFFLIMAGFSQLLSINWRDRELQVVTGMGFYAIVNLMVMLFSSHQGSRHHIQWFSFAGSISYLGTLGYWVLSFLAKDYERKEFSPQMQQFLVYMSGNTANARTGSLALGKIPPDHTRNRDK